MFDFFPILFFVFIVWRLTNLLLFEDGPLDIFQNFRKRIGVDPEIDEQVGYLPRLFTCDWCMSVMVSLLLWIPFMFVPTWFFIGFGWLGISTAVLLVTKVMDS